MPLLRCRSSQNERKFEATLMKTWKTAKLFDILPQASVILCLRGSPPLQVWGLGCPGGYGAYNSMGLMSLACHKRQECNNQSGCKCVASSGRDIRVVCANPILWLRSSRVSAPMVNLVLLILCVISNKLPRVTQYSCLIQCHFSIDMKCSLLVVEFIFVNRVITYWSHTGFVHWQVGLESANWYFLRTCDWIV